MLVRGHAACWSAGTHLATVAPMSRTPFLRPVAPLLFVATIVACEKNDDKRPPEVARNTDHVAYATEYPERVEQTTKELDEQKARAQELCSQAEGYADKLQDPSDYKLVGDVYDAAEASGKSGNYVERQRQNRAFSRMLEENDGEIGKATMASVHGAAQHDNCPNPGNVAGAAKAGLKRGVDKRSETRLREANEGHRVIDRNEDALGKKNRPALEQQADEIAEASYIANVELAELAYELERLIEEHEKVLRTLEDEIKEEKRLQEKEGTSDADKKASEARVKELEEAKEKVAAQKEVLEERKKDKEKLAKEIKQVQDDCKKSRKALDGKLEEKGKTAAVDKK